MSKHLAGSTVCECVCVSVCVYVPGEIYCNVSGEAVVGL